MWVRKSGWISTGLCVVLAFAAVTNRSAVHVAEAESHHLNVLYAGSMTHSMETVIGPAIARKFGIQVQGEGAGSSELAGFISAGQKPTDLFISASPSVIEKDLMGPKNHDAASWYLTLAGDSLVIAYSPKSRFAPQLRQAARGQIPWYQVLGASGFRLGRTDPVLDPKGVYSLVMFSLANRFYHNPHLSDHILGPTENPSQVFPEEDLLARLNTGQLDAVIAYHHEAVEWHLPDVSLPDAINLGSSKYAKAYASTKVNVDGSLKTGGLIQFALTIPTEAKNTTDAVTVARYLLSGRGHTLLMQDGFTPVGIHLTGSYQALPSGLRTLLSGAREPK